MKTLRDCLPEDVARALEATTAPDLDSFDRNAAVDVALDLLDYGHIVSFMVTKDSLSMAPTQPVEFIPLKVVINRDGCKVVD